MSQLKSVRIIGIDCAADPKNIAVASATMTTTGLTVDDVFLGDSAGDTRTDRLRRLAAAISGVISEGREPTLLALDAPLGWPVEMRNVLANSVAGSAPDIPDDARYLFRRATDRFVARTTGKTPQTVGASLVASLTHTALRLLSMIAKKCEEHSLSMEKTALTRDDLLSEDVHVKLIEVYPALAGPQFLGAVSRPPTSWSEVGDKLKKFKEENWDFIEEQLRRRLQIDFALGESVKTDSKRFRDHGLDAILCAWTGFRFLQGKCVPPRSAKAKISDERLKKEGWIWFDKETPRWGDTAQGPKPRAPSKPTTGG